MIKQSWHIFAVALIFFGVERALDAAHFWDAIGVGHPHGYLYQGLLFLGFYFVMQNTLFVPYLHVLHEREAQTSGKRRQVEATAEKAKNLLTNYQAAISEARMKAVKERELVLIKTEEDIKTQLEGAKKNASAHLAAEKIQIQNDVTEAKKSQSQNAKMLMQEVVGTIMQTPNTSAAKRSANAG